MQLFALFAELCQSCCISQWQRTIKSCQESRCLSPHHEVVRTQTLKANTYDSVRCSRLQMSAKRKNVCVRISPSSFTFWAVNSTPPLFLFLITQCPWRAGFHAIVVSLLGFDSHRCSCFLSPGRSDAWINAEMTRFCMDSSHFSVWKLRVTSVLVSHRQNVTATWALATAGCFSASHPPSYRRLDPIR